MNAYDYIASDLYLLRRAGKRTLIEENKLSTGSWQHRSLQGFLKLSEVEDLWADGGDDEVTNAALNIRW